MTADEEATLLTLYAQGKSYRQMAAELGRGLATVAGWVEALAAEGKLVKRPRGSSPRGRRAQTPAPVQRPVQPTDTGAVSSVDTGAVQPFDTGPVQRLDRLESEVQDLRTLMRSVIDRLDHPPVQTPVQITTLPPYPKGKAVRWNLWILDAIKDQVSALAAERELSPSELVQEYLWKALNDPSSSTP